MTLNSLKRDLKSKQTAFFCGAGISFHSGLPLAQDFVVAFLSHLRLPRTDINILIKCGLPFEAFAEIIIKETGSMSFLDIYEKGRPATTHDFIANLVKQKIVRLVVTTNFDTLLEQAFFKVGLKEGKDFNVLSNEADFKNITIHSRKVLLIKIHGTIAKKRAMGVTLKNIAMTSLNKGRRRIIEYLLSTGPHTHVVIIGYSCSDIFDITPEILSLKRAKKISYIHHRHNQMNIDTSSFYKKKGELPFSHLTRAKKISVNTDYLIKMLWEENLSETYSMKQTVAGNWQDYLASWINSSLEKDSSIGERIFGRLLFSVSEYRLALRHYQLSLKKSRTPRAKLLALSNIGLVYKELGDYARAIRYQKNAVFMAKKTRQRTKYCSSLNNLAYTFLFAGDIDSALRHQMQSYKLAKKIRNTELLAINYCNLGIIYGEKKDYDTAYKHFKKSTDIMREIGLKLWEALSLNNMGIALRNLKRFQEALECHQAALEISKNIANRHQESQTRGNLGRIYLMLGQPNEASYNLKQSIKLARIASSPKTEYHSLNVMAQLNETIGKKSLSRYYRKKAASLSNQSR